MIGGRGLGTFITYTPATYERRRLHHRIRKEISKVTATVNAARVEVLDEYNYRGLTEFAVFHSYLSTAHKWGKDKLEVLTELFPTGPWLPRALTPS